MSLTVYGGAILRKLHKEPAVIYSLAIFTKDMNYALSDFKTLDICQLNSDHLILHESNQFVDSCSVLCMSIIVCSVQEGADSGTRDSTLNQCSPGQRWVFHQMEHVLQDSNLWLKGKEAAMHLLQYKAVVSTVWLAAASILMILFFTSLTQVIPSAFRAFDFQMSAAEKSTYIPRLSFPPVQLFKNRRKKKNTCIKVPSTDKYGNFKVWKNKNQVWEIICVSRLIPLFCFLKYKTENFYFNFQGLTIDNFSTLTTILKSIQWGKNGLVNICNIIS